MKKKKEKRRGTSERRRLTGVLDDLARRLCKVRDEGKCRRCARLGLEAHHIFSRRHNAIRFTLSNLISLCPSCHRFAHSKPNDFRAWVIEEIGNEGFEELERARNWPELSLEQMEKLITLYRGSL